MIFSVTFLLLSVMGCSKNQVNDEGSLETSLNNGEQAYEVIAENLKEPWEIVLHGDTFYISERQGAIVEMQGDSFTRREVKLDKNVSRQPEAGLLGLAIPNDFDQTKTAFAYYSYQNAGEFYQRIVTIKQNNGTWNETNILLDKIPGGQYHQGGRIKIGPDNKLYITTGDTTVPELAQDANSLAGKILRMNLDGSVPEDNPFENSYVYTFGHRNPQGLAWDKDGNLYATEHGPSAHDEINLIKKGSNYGWPLIQGDEENPGMESPVIHSGNETWAPSGMAYLNGLFYFASLRGEGVRLFDPSKKSQHLIVSDVGRVRDILAENEGIYFITNNTDGRGTPLSNDDRLLFLPIEAIKP